MWDRHPQPRAEDVAGVRALHSVVGIVARGQIPGPTVSWISSASLTASKKQHVNHRPVAVENTRQGFAGHGDRARHASSIRRSWGLERRTVASPSSTAFDGGHVAMTTTISAAFHGPRERAQPDRQGLFLARNSTNRSWTGQVQRLVQFERELRLVRFREHPEQKMSSTGPFGELALRPGAPRGHLRGTDHVPKPPTAQCTWRSSIHDGTICACHKATQTFFKGLTKGLDDRGLQLNIPSVPCEGPGGVEGPPRQMLRAVGSRLRSPRPLPPHALGKAGPGGETHGPTRRPPPSFSFRSAATPARCHQTSLMLRLWCIIPGSHHVLRSPGSPNSPNTQRHQPRTGPAHLFDTSSRFSACHFATGSLGFHDRRSHFSRNGRLMASVGWPDPEMSDTDTTTTKGPVP